MLPKAMAHSLQRPQPGARQYPSGTMPSQNMGQQSASGMPSSSLKLKPAMASQFPGEPGVTSTTHPKRLNTRISNEPVHVDREGGQSSSYGSPPLGGARQETSQNLFAMSARKSDEDEADLDQY